MADHSKPTLTSNYTAFVDEIKGRLEDISKGFDPAKTSPTNVPVDTIRWVSSSNKWQRWNGSAWVDLASTYAISISGSAAKLTTARSIALSGGATGSASFDGSANITISVDALNPSQLASPVPINKGGTGASTAEQARINLGVAAGDDERFAFRGLIAMYSGSVASIPSGWALCDGQNGTPNLTGRFIVAAGGDYAVGDTGDGTIPSHSHAAGTLSATTGGAHTHTGSTNSTGAHNHEIEWRPGSNKDGLTIGGGTDTPFYTAITIRAKSAGAHSHSLTINSGGAHTHTISGSTAAAGSGSEVIAKYYALAYIMKL